MVDDCGTIIFMLMSHGRARLFHLEESVRCIF